MIGAGVPPITVPAPNSMDATAWVIFTVFLVVAIGCFVYGLVRALRTWPPAKAEVNQVRHEVPKAA